MHLKNIVKEQKKKEEYGETTKMLNAHAVRQTYRDTLNYYRRHITSSGLIVFSHCIRIGHATKRSMRECARCACIVFHTFFVFFFFAVNRRINEIKYAGHSTGIYGHVCELIVYTNRV